MRRGKGDTRHTNAAPHTSTCARCSDRALRATLGHDANTGDVGAPALLQACLLLLQIASRKLRLKRLRTLCVSPRIGTPIDFRKNASHLQRMTNDEQSSAITMKASRTAWVYRQNDDETRTPRYKNHEHLHERTLLL